MDEKLGLSGEGYSPALVRKIVRQGGKAASFADAAGDLEELVGLKISAKHIDRLTTRVGREWAAADAADVEKFKQRKLAREQTVAREAASVSVDGGRVQIRADDGPPGVHGGHWAETKVASCMSLSSKESQKDPQPTPPEKFTQEPAVKKLTAQMKRRTGASAERTARPENPQAKTPLKKKPRKHIARPEMLVPTVVAGMMTSEEFGYKVAAEVHRRGLDLAARKGYVCDGQHCNWTIYDVHFQPAGFVAIVDFVHLLCYLFAASQAARGKGTPEAWALYLVWLGWAWSGAADQILAGLRAESARLGLPPAGADDADPRNVVAGAATYVSNNQGRMDYSRYRKMGLPISSANVESTIKRINRRVKASDKFWLNGGADAVLHVRAAYLSEDGRTDRYWSRARPRTRAACHGQLKMAS